VKLQPNTPFTWASGWKSPIYCDNRKTLSFPEARDYIKNSFAELLTQRFGRPDCIAGVATGGIAIGALVADALDLPFVYVRSTAKGHGLGNQIEGTLEPGHKVVVIEDLISTGMSSLQAVDALRDFGANVQGLLAIFTYGFEKSVNAFAEANCQFHTLSEYDTLVAIAAKENYVEQSDLQALRNWRKDPANWSPQLAG